MTSFVTVPDHAAKYERLRDELQRERIAILTEVAEAAREFEATLSDYCDGPERDRLRAALAAAQK